MFPTLLHPPFSSARRWFGCASLGLALAVATGCKRTDEESAVRARAHAKELAELTLRDAAEVRKGLPLGAQQLAQRWAQSGVDLLNDAEAARDEINRARNKVQDLRVAKSTFFALAAPDGRIVRNDREQDLMAGAQLFKAFPALERAAQGPYVEALGVMPEAHGVRGKPDGEWAAAAGVDVGGQIRGLYVSGWAWSSYAFRLEFSLRNRITNELRGQRENLPLLYVFVLVGDDVYGTPESPEINAQAIAERKPLANLSPDGSFSALLEITGRDFALGVQAVPELAAGVAIGVLRSET
ncbi:MAG TPA: hypothetical protein VMG12_02380 [Polyangiaceae bacterium]|nr:hypothetical protein [Polyangiaceae bacterium]